MLIWHMTGVRSGFCRLIAALTRSLEFISEAQVINQALRKSTDEVRQQATCRLRCRSVSEPILTSRFVGNTEGIFHSCKNLVSSHFRPPGGRCRTANLKVWGTSQR